MKQSCFSELEYAGKKKRTSRELFLNKINRLIPWERLLNVFEPHYLPHAHKGGRPPIGLEKMPQALRVKKASVRKKPLYA